MNEQPLLLATCRAEPNSADQHNHVPLPAGEYHLLIVAHRRAAATDARHCRTCAAAPPFVTKGHPRALPGGDVIVMVHGFNCTQQSGIETAFNVRDALAAWGLPLVAPEEGTAAPTEGAAQVIGFTWPCEHTLFPGYMADKEAVARFAAFSLANLITDLRRQQPTRHIHLIAHSMGCFLTLKALNMLAVLHNTHEDDANPPLTTVTWLAPDINADALERSTPGSLRVRAWRHPSRWLFAQRMAMRFARPQREDEPPGATPVPVHADATHPLDGYGYAALDVVRQLHIYSSLRDEALWASPLANHATEESGSASGSIRLGWCGPLHPQLVMAADGHQGHRTREVALIDCTAIISEHGGYFFDATVQRDLTARLAHAQGLSQPAPPAERQTLSAWHAGAPLQFPQGKQTMPRGLSLWRFCPPNPQTDVTQPDTAPVMAQGSLTLLFANLWRNPVAGGVLKLWIRLLRAYYRV